MSAEPEPIRARCGIVGQMMAMYRQEFGLPSEPEPDFTHLATIYTPSDFTHSARVLIGHPNEPIPDLPDVHGFGLREGDADARFEASSPLRVESDELDSMGADYDPSVPGVAESWFRKLRDGGE